MPLKKSPVINATDLYPYGAPAISYSRENSLKQDKILNGKETQDELGYNVVDLGQRDIDPYVPVFPAIDRFAEKYHWMSPYQYTAGNPVKYVDVNGDSVILSETFRSDKVAMEIYGKWSQTDAGKTFLKNYGEGGKHEDVAVVFGVAVLTPGTRGETGAYAVNKETGDEKILTDQRTIDAKREKGQDVSGMKSTLDKAEYLRFRLTIDKVNDSEEYVKKNRQETMTHESQHVILGTMDIKRDEKVDWSGKNQHTIMKTNNTLIMQRFNTLKSVRPDLSDAAIMKAVLGFEK